MPIVKIDTKLIYFAHVPKCAGSAIENYLHGRFGRLGFLDRGFLKIPRRKRWSRSSPQHIDVDALDRLLPPCFFAARFAVVRHPADRMASVFRYQRDIECNIPADVTFGEWLETLQHLARNTPFHLDNHYRSMKDLVPQDATIFRLEDGLNPLVAWLDELAGNSDGAREISITNTYDERIADKKIEPGPATKVTKADLRKIQSFYREDFERFGYVPETVE